MERVTVCLHGAYCLSKLDEQFWDYCTFRDLKVSQDLLDSKATQVLRSVLNTSSDIGFFFPLIFAALNIVFHSDFRDFLALKEQLDLLEIR